MYLSTSFSSVAVLALAHTVVAVPEFEKVQHAEVELDLESRIVVPIAGGSKIGFPIAKVTVTSDSLFNATCSGYAWTSTWDAGSEAEYSDLEVRMDCETADGLPFNAIEVGSGKSSETTLRRITYEIGAPFEHLRAQYFIAEVVSPAPELAVDIYRYITN